MTGGLAAPLERPIAVLSSRTIPAVGVADRAAYDEHQLEVVSLAGALETPWGSDAHVCFYRPDPIDAVTPEGTWPRILKAGEVVGSLRERGADLVSDLLALDFDTEGHEPWTASTREAWLATLVRAAEDPGFVAGRSWCALYLTRAGARLVYALDRPLKVEAVPPFLRGLQAAWRARGLAPDPLTDWTRLMRLPRVLRDGKRSEEDPFFFLVPQPDAVLPVDSIEPLGRADTVLRSAADLEDFEVPNPTEIANLIVDPSSRATKPDKRLTAWGQAAHRALFNLECHKYCHDLPYNEVGGSKQTWQEGTRNAGILREVGQAVSRLFPKPWCGQGVEGTTPRHVYALFIRAVEALDRDENWPRYLYDKVRWVWARAAGEAQADELAHAEAAAKAADVAQAQAADAASLQERIMAGVATWWPDLRAMPEEVRWARVSERLIACGNRTHYVMRADGLYDPVGVPRELLHTRIRELGMEAVLPLSTFDQNGVEKATTVAELVQAHGCTVAQIEGRSELLGCRVAGFGTDRPTLEFPLYRRRTDLAPRFDPDVDAWLVELVGQKHVEKLRTWIAWSLAWDEGPTCALSLAGAAGAGKGLLAKGLAETTNTGRVATGQDLIGKHSTGLLESPWVVVNEGFPTSRGSVNPADSFRRVVAGEIEAIDPKFKDPVHIRSAPRVLLTANTLDVALSLAAGKDLTPQDRDAIAVRLLHFNVRDEAAKWIVARGGEAGLTGRPGHRWIAGDGAGAPSDFVLARHFLYLYQNRGKRPGVRFLVDGENGGDLLLLLRLSGAGLGVVETIISMINAAFTATGSDRVRGQFRSIACEDDSIYVLSGGVMEYARERMIGKDAFDAAQLANALKGLRLDEPVRRVLKSRPDIGKSYWQKLDTAVLWRYASRELGIPCPLLSRLVEGEAAPVTMIPTATKPRKPVPPPARQKEAGA